MPKQRNNFLRHPKIYNNMHCRALDNISILLARGNFCCCLFITDIPPIHVVFCMVIKIHKTSYNIWFGIEFSENDNNVVFNYSLVVLNKVD